MADLNKLDEARPLSFPWWKWKRIAWRDVSSGICAVIFMLIFICLAWYGIALVDGFHLAGG